MKKIVLTAALFLSAVCSAQSVEKIEFLDVKGFYTNPVFSPSGSHLLVSGEHLNGVYVLDLATNEITKITGAKGSGYGYSWDANQPIVYYRFKEPGDYFKNSKVYSYNIKTKEHQGVADLNHNYLPSFNGFDKDQVVVYTNQETLQVEAKDLKSGKQWSITNEKQGQFYHAIKSPDGKQVAVHNGSEIMVYPMDGSGRGKVVGVGIATQWTADGKYIVGFLDESQDGHIITNSDIYVFDVENAKTIKASNTEIISEMYPTVHGNTIIYSDDKSGKLIRSFLKI